MIGVNKLFENVLKKPGFWTQSGPFNDIVLSSRVRLARNVKSVPFPNNMDEGDISIVDSLIDKFISSSIYSDKIIMVDLNSIESNEKRILRERNIITYEMEISRNSKVLINNENDFTVLINDEDHFRIQVIKPGLQLFEAYSLANSVDDELNKFVPYAFLDDMGYLSACPSNLGTGLRASVLLHLPVITMKKKMNEITSALKKNGIEIKGTISDSQRSLGSIFQVSNRVTLGISEVDILEKLDNEVNSILETEDRLRDEYFSKSRNELEDLIWRSYGVLKYSRKISYVEAMEHLSNVRLGIIFALIKNINISLINNLMVNIQWSHMQRNFGKIFRSTIEGDQTRAEYIRFNLE